MDRAQTTSRTCEIPLKNGEPCGILAIRRCVTCERAFCLSHYSGSEWAYIAESGWALADQCSDCIAKVWADMEEQQRKALARDDEAREYFRSGSARTALLTSRVQPVVIYHIEEEFKYGLWGFGGYRLFRKVTAIGRGWILGEFHWRYSSIARDGMSHEVGRVILTALLDVDPSQLLVTQVRGKLNGQGLPRIDQDPSQPLFTPVKPYSDGYEYVGRRDTGGGNSESVVGLDHGWIEVAQAVSRLIGPSS